MSAKDITKYFHSFWIGNKTNIMKLITFLLLLIAVNCSGQKIEQGNGFVMLGPTYTGINNTNLYFLVDANGKRSHIWIIYTSYNRKDTAAYMDTDSNIVIKDTMATIRELFVYISAQEKQLNNSYVLQGKLYRRMNDIFKHNYVVDRKKFDKKVNDLKVSP